MQSSYYSNSVDTSGLGQVLLIEGGSTIFTYGLGDQTTQLLSMMYNRFGPITSFTGSFIADEWTLRLNRTDPCHGENLANPVVVPDASTPHRCSFIYIFFFWGGGGGGGRLELKTYAYWYCFVRFVRHHELC